MRIEATLILLCSSATAALAFTPTSRGVAAPSSSRCTASSSSSLYVSTEDVAEPTAEEQSTTASINDSLQIPLSYNEMILQTSQAMTDALAAGRTRQIVRILLPRDAANDNFGVFQEAEAQTSNSNALNAAESTKLVPTDESWQGGIMQLYRAAAPTTKDILRQLSPTMRDAGVPPKIVEDRTIDESGVDGVGLLYTQIGKSGGDEVKGEDEAEGGVFGAFGFAESVTLPTLSEDDMCVFVQPNQEVIDSIETLSTQSAASASSPNSPLIALINPQWRNVDDALDSASKSDNVFGAFASFLGGKGNSMKRLDTLGYETTYSLEGYVCKGGNIRLLKRFDSDWIAFAENDAGDAWVRVGQQADRPRYQDVEKFLDDKGVGFKYARDLGMIPKL
eukprot:CAMPEP_0113414884 /NCGR_PEP_ID=MMETSP0013_2-20120614/24263_1 /TAXON_ID=2843 ORGANISM="Skeletonema costatum, Strain 1716" /NCGR_SAMPLE_ID=MMETSP0013_2 /ASSEMBLY_ACC=CAM_ASM_000158 /LENGTH=391 /DNA_ID=CAMNT_0000301787 /DNA_START=27 /DNA_END=1202 /DNA_ORIENTATION=- /assembly_acc=CAM_ASM_000158